MEKKFFFVKIETSLVKVLLKITLCLCIYFVFKKRTFFLILFKIDTIKLHPVYFNNFDIPFKNKRHWIR